MKKMLFMLLLSGNLLAQYNKAKKEIVSLSNEVVTKTTSTLNKIDTSSTTKMLYTDIKHGMGFVSSKVAGAIESLAHGLGVASERVYTVLTKQYFLEGLVQLVMMIFGFLSLIFITYNFKNILNRFVKNGENEAGEVYLLYVPFCIILFLILNSYFSDFPKIVAQVLNPEYKTIEFILQETKKLIK